VYIISLSRAGLDDTTLSSAIGDLPSRCIALMEDIDAAFTRGISREQDDGATDNEADPDPNNRSHGTPASRVTLSGLLNALDGVGAQEGRILFATTNRYHALDGALVRPGRLDLHVEFHFASRYQIRELFQTFYLPRDVETIVKDAGSDTQEKNEHSNSDLDNDLIDLGLPGLGAEKSAVAPPTPLSSAGSSPSSSPQLPTASLAEPKSASGPPCASATGTSHAARAPEFSAKQYAKLAEAFASCVPEETFSMAALQGYLMVS
jgi:chaperone BCS1